jgi:hypothetical protein
MVEYWVKDIYSAISLMRFVIPGLTRNPIFDFPDSCFRRFSLRLKLLCVKNQHSIIPTFHRSSSLFRKTHLGIDLGVG